MEHVHSLERELRARGHEIAREVYVTVYDEGEALVKQRLDMVVNDKLIIEVKSTWDLHASAQRQL